MKYLEYQERRPQGTFDFPIAYYHVEKTHPRYAMPYHWHPECEIIRIIEGTFSMTIDETQYDLTAGDLMFLQDGVLHGGTPSDCIYECVVFDMNLLLKDNHICRKQVEAIVKHELLIEQHLPGQDNALQQVTEILYTALRERYTGYEFMVQGALYQFIGLLLQQNLYTLRSRHDRQISDRLGQLKQVLRYIEAHYSESITLEDLASEANMNPNYFCRFFRQITQRTPIDYVNYYRIECACEQLSTTSATITEVALSCGFNDISYFIKTFRKYTGMTPRQYLRQRY